MDKIYLIEIWKYGSKVNDYESTDIKAVLDWYYCYYKSCFEYGGCTFYLYENGREMSFDEEYNYGFFV